MKIKVKWDTESNDEDHGWIYLDSEEHRQAVKGPIGRDRDALPEDLAAAIGYGLDIEFDSDEKRRRWGGND